MDRSFETIVIQIVDVPSGDCELGSVPQQMSKGFQDRYSLFPSVVVTLDVALGGHRRAPPEGLGLWVSDDAKTKSTEAGSMMQR